ncbi:MAG: hypothetical protein QM809_17195 [Gordonia sp. (in: high G+C Gram-positive bacteria)]|uniref:hypothetical protein n=1 Tax=Gordonia sp. (in: high G+C Gram-positive bacteria) TaxID=84139 RepID=UPI0039E3F51B
MIAYISALLTIGLCVWLGWWYVSKPLPPTEFILVNPPGLVELSDLDPSASLVSYLVCARTSRSSPRNDAHTCIGAPERAIWDPCFDVGENVVNCVSPQGVPEFSSPRRVEWHEFYFDKTGETGKYAIDTVIGNSYPWRIEIETEGGKKICNWPFSPQVAFNSENPTWECLTGGVMKMLITPPIDFIERGKSEILSLRGKGVEKNPGSAISLDMSKSPWVVKFASGGNTSFVDSVVTRAWF